MADDWMTDAHKAAALEGWRSNPVAQAYARQQAADEKRREHDERLPFDTLAIPNTRHEGEFTTFGDARYLRMHGCTDPVPVRLVEDPEGNYLTWLSYEDDEREPIFTLWHTIFDMQFPYGHKAEEQAGRGRAVRVRAETR